MENVNNLTDATSVTCLYALSAKPMKVGWRQNAQESLLQRNK